MEQGFGSSQLGRLLLWVTARLRVGRRSGSTLAPAALPLAASIATAAAAAQAAAAHAAAAEPAAAWPAAASATAAASLATATKPAAVSATLAAAAAAALGNCLCVHSPQQVCVAVTYTDIRGGGKKCLRTARQPNKRCADMFRPTCGSGNADGGGGKERERPRRDSQTSATLSDTVPLNMGMWDGKEPTRRGGGDGKGKGSDDRSPSAATKTRAAAPTRQQWGGGYI